MSFLEKIFGQKPSVDFKTLAKEGTLILDVRTPGEFASGHIAGSVNVPLDSLPSKMAGIKSQNKTIIAVCRSGSRSGMAVTLLKNAGITAHNGGPWDGLAAKIR